MYNFSSGIANIKRVCYLFLRVLAVLKACVQVVNGCRAVTYAKHTFQPGFFAVLPGGRFAFYSPDWVSAVRGHDDK